MKILTHISRFWLVYLQLILCTNSFYVNTIDFKQHSSLPTLILTSLTHIMYLYTLYCSCKVSTAPRNESEQSNSTFCQKCQQSVYIRDHHCVFIGQCAGKHNYKHFFSYMFYSYVLTAGNLYSCYLHWHYSDFTLSQMWEFYSWLLIIRLAGFLGSALWFSIFTGQLLAYQFLMIVNGITAREHKKRTEPLKYTQLTALKALFNKKKRAEMFKCFRQRWLLFFNSKFEFLYCDLE